MAASDSVGRPLRWGRILGVLVAGFLFVEAAAQAYFVHWTGRPFGSIFLYVWSPYGLVRNNPALTGNFAISRDGFREVRNYERNKPANTFRVMLVGGSVLYSGSSPINALKGYVPSDRTISQYMTKLLQADPAFKGVNVEVINAGVNYNRITEISSAYLADYIRWSPDVLVVFGSANNFDHAIREGDVEATRTALLGDHHWRGEFDRLVNERSLGAALENGFRQAVDTSASLAILHKAMMRGFVENDPFVRLAMPRQGATSAPRPIAAPQDEDRHFQLYASYASAIIAAARRSDQDVAFVWEYHLGDLGGRKSLSPDEASLYPHVKRAQDQIDYDHRMHERWREFLASENVVGVDPLAAISATSDTVFTDYLHYTAHGNAVVARATYAQLRDGLVQKLEANKAKEAARQP